MERRQVPTAAILGWRDLEGKSEKANANPRHSPCLFSAPHSRAGFLDYYGLSPYIPISDFHQKDKQVPSHNSRQVEGLNSFAV